MDLSTLFDTGGSTSTTASISDTSATVAVPSSISSVTTSVINLTSSITAPSSTILTTSTLSPSSASVPSTSSSSDSSSTLSAATSLITSTSSTLSTPSITSTVFATSTSSTGTTPSFTTSVQFTTVSNGGTQTITVINSITPIASASPSTAASIGSSSSSFWSNKGAVAGTFTVVSLVSVAILILAITFMIRRRRARRLDREHEAAAADAAKATAPAFLDDDHDRPIYSYDYLSAGDMGGNYGLYEGGGYTGAVPSASSHGTFNQPPMGFQSNESYPMVEVGSSLYPGVSAYPIFTGLAQTPQTNNYHDHSYAANDTPSSLPMKATRPKSGDFSALDMPQRYEGGSDVYSGTTYTTPTISRGHSTTTSASHSQIGLSRNKSQGSRSLIDGYYSKPPSTTGGHDFVSPNSGESYAAHYQPGFSGMPKSASPSRRGTFGYDEVPPLPNSFTGTIDNEGVYESDDERPQPKKVLKVANE
ncbi:hypothetical protein DFJ43DRAFT_220919 [Lentinula guzmanii]|uniref:REJ domain-containing protein n=1 Tax=Lentinula guzmanii TaxID=2804957 RepID=A0AA38N1A4_9AGAR|nr:hypothetical protein DFJ43DRAFT_220919 [Lentinula guzmanii]